MSNIKYTVGEKVIVCANVANELYAWHCFNIGTTCTIVKAGDNGFYLVRDSNNVEYWLKSCDFRPVSTSSSIEEYKARKIDMGADGEAGFQYDM